jgi:NAD(P)-dependent dehydrogenase (short-subunit alcohol dehydrogenase family)
MGADAPIAAAIALVLAQHGADVAVTSTTGDTEEAFSLRGLRRSIEASGRRAIADIADLSNGSSTQIAVRQIAKQLGGIDLLVIAPRDGLTKPSERISDAEWHRALNFNLGAYFFACRAALREFVGNTSEPRGRIIALLPGRTEDDSPALLAARAGAEALIKALAREWAAQQVILAGIRLPRDEEQEPLRQKAVDAALHLAEAGSEASGTIVELA